MEIDADDCRRIFEEMNERATRALAMGGIPMHKAVDGQTVPDGWVLDFLTDIFVPRPLDAAIN